MAKKWGGTSIVQYRSSRRGSANTYSVFLHPDGWIYCDCPGWRFCKDAPAMQARTCTHTRKVVAAGFVTRTDAWTEPRPRWILVEVAATDDALQVQPVDPLDAIARRIVIAMLEAAPFRIAARAYQDGGSEADGSRGVNMADVLKRELRAYVPAAVTTRLLPDNLSRPRRGIIFED